MWPNKVADGNTKTTTPGLLSDFKEYELEEASGIVNSNSSNISEDQSANSSAIQSNSTNQNIGLEEFPILDELDRLAKVLNLINF